MAKIRRYTLPIVLAAIALILLTVGILALTVWKPQQQVVAERSTDQPFTMTRAGVLPLYADQVTVKATADQGETVWLAVGSPEDVSAWLADESYDEIVGLSTLTELKATPHSVQGEATDEQQSGEEDADEGAVSNPISSDMWTAIKYGNGSVSLVLTGDELQDSILAATDGVGPAPTITLSWDTPRANMLAVVSFILMGIFWFLAAVAFGAMFATRSRRKTRSAQIQARGQHDLTETTMIRPLDENEVTESEMVRALPAAAVVTSLTPKALEGAFEEVDEAREEREEGSEAPPASEGDRVDDDPARTQKEVQEGAEEQAHAQTEQEDAAVVAEAVAETEAVVEEREQPGGAEPAVEEPVVEEPSVGESVETVTTESGMLNLAALQGGGAFPTRRAMREAQKRGIDALVVEGRRFPTRRSLAETGSSAPEDVLKKRSVRGLGWEELLERSADKVENSGDN